MKTTINGKEIELVNRNYISNIVSQKVAEMFGQGFTLYFMNGSQGEEGKVCLTNDGGKTVWIFWIHKEYERLDTEGWHSADVLYITGKKYSNVTEGKTLWFKEGELFFEQKWFKLDTGKELYTENVEDWKMVDDLKTERRHLRYELHDMRKEKNFFLSDNVKKIALRIIRKQKGYKSTSLKDIKGISFHVSGGWYFSFTEESNKSMLFVSL